MEFSRRERFKPYFIIFSLYSCPFQAWAFRLNTNDDEWGYTVTESRMKALKRNTVNVQNEKALKRNIVNV